MIRLSPYLALALFVPLLARTKPCSCVVEEPCVYDEIEIDSDYETMRGTTVAEDLEWLQEPQMGTWRWGESTDAIEIGEAGVERPAIATWVHEGGKRFVEQVDGGVGVACRGPTVELDGTWTVTDAEDNSVIVSFPLTIEYEYTASLSYGAVPVFNSPFNDTWPSVLELAEGWDQSLIHGAVLWPNEDRVYADFYYHSQRMDTTTTGSGSFAMVAVFDTG